MAESRAYIKSGVRFEVKSNSFYHGCIHRPLIPMTSALIFGIWLGVWQPGSVGWALAAALMTAVVLIISICRTRWLVLLPLAMCLLGGYLSIQPWLGADIPDHHVVRYADKGYWIIHGVVENAPEVRQEKWHFVISANRLVNKEKVYEVCGRVRVSGRGEWPHPKAGDHVVFRGRLKSIHNFNNPGGFDYRRYMRLKGVQARIYATKGSLKIESAARGGRWLQHVDDLRKGLGSQMDAALPGCRPHTLHLLKALILGERGLVSTDLREKFNQAGVGHVLAISGLHVGMVAAISFAVALRILALIPWVLKRAWVRKGAALLSLVPVLGYGIIAGLSPSTQRAMVMVTVFLLSFWIGRRHDWLNTLALAALVILVVFPPALLSISFQLSFTAVLAIVIGTRFWPGRDVQVESTLWKRVLRRLLAFLWVSALAILGTLPLVLHYFNQVSLVGLAANLIVVPIMAFIVVPFGLLGTLGVAIHSDLGALVWQVSAWGIDWMLWTVELISSRPWAAVKSVTPSGLEILLYYAFIGVCLFWKKLSHAKVWGASVLLLCALDAGYWGYQRFGRDDLRLTVVDVGQASANLLELPGGYTILIDGGGFSDNSSFDVGARVLAPFLWHKKIKTIDLVVLTHANSDHLNGLLYILDNFNVGEVWSNQEPASTKGFEKWVKLLADHNISHPDFEQMPRRITRYGVCLELLAPPTDFLKRKTKEPWRDSNNNSLVMRVCHGDVCFLFTGDIMHQAEDDLVRRIGRNRLHSTVLIVPHHGSKSSSTHFFIKAVKPEASIISAGWQNRFRFPHPGVLKRLEAVGSRVWCTAEHGAVMVKSNGKRYEINTMLRAKQKK